MFRKWWGCDPARAHGYILDVRGQLSVELVGARIIDPILFMTRVSQICDARLGSDKMCTSR
jgi:hypothetical protein